MRKYLILASLFLAACNQAADTIAPAESPAETDTNGAAETEAPAAYKTLDGTLPIIIAHRGASGLYPEHTLKAYQTAIDQELTS